MPIERVAVTGGNGWIGSAILRELADHGYETVNVSRGEPDNDIADRYVRTDTTSAEDVRDAVDQTRPDAIVHMGTLPGPKEGVPPHRTYESTVMSSFHVLQAASEFGVASVALPSSINVMGAEWQDGPIAVDYLPVDEDHPCRPEDEEYSLAKHAMEVTADGFGRGEGAPTTISSLRLPWVGDDEGFGDVFGDGDRTIEGLRDPDAPQARDVLFSYLHVADAARAARLAVEADFEGHEAFWLTATDTSASVPSEELVAAFYPDAAVRTSLEGHAGLVDTSKAEALLGWSPRHTWRTE